MPRRYPAEVRHQVIELARSGTKVAQLAATFGMSLDSFERHTQPELRLVRRGRMRLVPMRELEQWLERTQSVPLPKNWGRRRDALARRGH